MNITLFLKNKILFVNKVSRGSSNKPIGPFEGRYFKNNSFSSGVVIILLPQSTFEQAIWVAISSRICCADFQDILIMLLKF